MPRVLTFVGVLLQLAGAACIVGWGLRPVWRQVAAQGDRLIDLDTARAAARRAWRRWADATLRWIGRPRSRTIAISGATSLGGLAGSARLSKSYSPLAVDLSTDDKIAELDRRTQAITADIGRIESRLLDRLDDQGRHHEDLSREFHHYVGEQARHAKQREIHEIRVQAAGLFLVTLGTIFQAVGSFLAPGS